MNSIKTLLLLMALPLAALASDDVVLEGKTAAANLERLKLKAEVGEVSIQAGEAGVVRWRVALEPESGWFTSDAAVREKLRKTRVNSRTGDGALRLQLAYPRGVDHDDSKQHWTVEVPAGFAVEVEHGVGELRVERVSGGVRADVGVGRARVDVPAGGVTVELGVGDIDVVSATGSVGDIDLHAGVGNTTARLRDRDLPVDRKGPKADLRHGGEGDDDYRLSAGVGDVRLEVKEQAAAR